MNEKVPTGEFNLEEFLGKMGYYVVKEFLKDLPKLLRGRFTEVRSRKIFELINIECARDPEHFFLISLYPYIAKQYVEYICNKQVPKPKKLKKKIIKHLENIKFFLEHRDKVIKELIPANLRQKLAKDLSKYYKFYHSLRENDYKRILLKGRNKKFIQRFYKYGEGYWYDKPDLNAIYRELREIINEGIRNEDSIFNELIERMYEIPNKTFTTYDIPIHEKIRELLKTPKKL